MHDNQVNSSSPSFTSLTLTTSTDPAPLVSPRTDSSTSRNVPGSTSKTCLIYYHDNSNHNNITPTSNKSGSCDCSSIWQSNCFNFSMTFFVSLAGAVTFSFILARSIGMWSFNCFITSSAYDNCTIHIHKNCCNVASVVLSLNYQHTVHIAWTCLNKYLHGNMIEWRGNRTT